jgi:competence protein ComEC
MIQFYSPLTIHFTFKDESMYCLFVFSMAVFSVSLFPVLPHHSLIFLLFIGAFFMGYCRVYVMMSLLLGVCVGSLLGYGLLSNQLPIALQGKPLTVTGVIIGLPEISDKKVQFFIKVIETEKHDNPSSQSLVGKKIKLSWYALPDKSVMPWLDYPQLSPGQKWQFTVKLRRPRGLVNPAGFDYQAYMLRNNISASGYVIFREKPLLLAESCWQGQGAIDCLRWSIQQKMQHLSARPAVLGALQGLMIGDTHRIAVAQWQLLKSTGTIHLFAISGLHIGLAATIGFFVGHVITKSMAIFLPFARLYQFLPAFFSIALAGIYSLLAGMSLPTQRALIMVFFFHLGRLLCYRIKPFSLLTFALVLISLVDPLAVQSQGFWLSFMAVAWLLYSFSGTNNRVHGAYFNSAYFNGAYLNSACLNNAISLAKAQWVLAIGLLLPNLWFLQGVSISAPLANLFAISWVSVVMVPLLFLWLLFAVIPLASLEFLVQWLYRVSEFSAEILLIFLQRLDEWSVPFHYLALGEFTLSGMVFSLIATCYVLLPKGVPYKYLSLLCICPLFFPAVSTGPLSVTFMDAGQGTAIVIQTSRKTLVYDLGRLYSERFSVAEHIVAPYLRHRGLSAVDMLMISHSDSDHAGGLTEFLAITSVNNIVSGQARLITPMLIKEDLVKGNLKSDDLIIEKRARKTFAKTVTKDSTGDSLVHQCHDGQHWEWDGVSFTVLWPPSERLKQPEPASNNNASCVLLVNYQGKTILLTGDIEKPVEQLLLQHPLLQKGIDIVLVPHHGSKTSSSLAWIKKLHPQWAVVTAGFANQYRHPYPSVVARYQNENSHFMNTAEMGAIRLFVDSQNNWQVLGWRVNFRRYWYD